MRLDEARKACESFASESEREMQKGKSYRRTRVSRKLAQFFIKSIDSIAIPNQVSFENLQTFQEDLAKMLFAVGRERDLWFPRISPLFIMVRRKIDVAFKSVADSLEKLRSLLSLKYSKMKAIENSFQTVDDITKSFDLLNEIEKNRKETELALGLVEKKIVENEEKHASLRSRGEITSLNDVNQKIEDFDKKVKHELRYIQKPFIKLQSLARSAEVSLFAEEKQKLDEYLQNPFLALATEEEGYSILKRILQKLDNAINQKKLKLKASRLKKAQEQIDALLNRNALEALHRSCKETLHQKQQLLASEVIATFQDEILKIEKDLAEMRRQKELAESRKASLEHELKETQDKIGRQKRSLEETVFNILGKKVKIVF